MSETVIVNAATVIAGASCAVDGFLIPVPPQVQFRAYCDAVHSVRFYVADADFSAISAASLLSAYTATGVASTAGTLGNVYTIDAGAYDYVACVVTNNSAGPATVTVAAGYDLVAEAPSALFTVAEAQAFSDSGILPLAAVQAAPIIAAEVVIRARFEAACRVALIPTSTTETLDGVRGGVLRVSRHNPCRELPRQPLTVTAASIDGVALTATELAALRCHPSGRIVRSDGSTWSSSSGYQDLAVSITYTHGWSAVPALVKRAGLLYCVRILNQGELPIGASGYTESGPPARFPYPGKRPHWTGDDEVDALLAEYEEDLAVVA